MVTTIGKGMAYLVKARFSNVYGPGEILGAGMWRGTVHTIWRNVIPTFIWRALNNESLELDNGGNASRDFIYVRDMARGLRARQSWVHTVRYTILRLAKRQQYFNYRNNK